MNRTAAVFSILVIADSVTAGTINWGSEFGSVNVQSDGATPVTAGFTIQLGKFTMGFDPSGGNVDLWAANWTVFDALLPGEHNAGFGYFTSEPELLNNNVFAPGDRAYVWMFNDQTAVPGSEWLLYTNDSTDSVVSDDWNFPAVPGSQQTMPLSWRVSNASRVVFGGFDPDRDGPKVPRQGDGYGTPPPGQFNLQTHTFVPEPSAGALAAAFLMLLPRRRTVLNRTPRLSSSVSHPWTPHPPSA